LEEICSEAQFEILKFERLSLSLASQQFGNGTKLIFLIRDPRAVVRSRKLNPEVEKWCNTKVCSNTKILCQQYLQDFKTAKWLQKHSPENFRFVQFLLYFSQMAWGQKMLLLLFPSILFNYYTILYYGLFPSTLAQY
jgi:hypothetical protein